MTYPRIPPLILASVLAATAFLATGSQAATRLDVHFVRAPQAVTNANEATLTFTKNVRKGIRSIRCCVDSGAWRVCSRAIVLGPLADGVHTARVRLVMKDGRKAADSRTWRIDTVAPEAPAVESVDTWSNDESSTVTRSASADPEPASGIARYDERVSSDGGSTWAPAPGGEQTTVSAEGQTIVEYRAVDAAGNTSAWSEGVVRLDRTAPGAPATAGGTGGWASGESVDVLDARDAADTLSGVTAGAYEVQVCDADGLCDARADVDGAVTVSTEGITTVRFRATDRAGNVGEWSQPETVMLDHTAPTAPTVTGGGSWANSDVAISNEKDAADALSGIDPAAYEYETSVDGVTWAAPEPDETGTVTVSREGRTLVRFRGRDEAGNAGPWSEPVPGGAGTAMIDRTAPAVPGVSGSAGWSSAASVTATISSSGDSLGAAEASGLSHYVVTSTTGTGTTAPRRTDGTLEVTDEGVTELSAAACDEAGNCSAYSEPGPASRVSIDRTAPTAPGIAGGGATWSNTPVRIANLGDAADATSGVDPAGYQVQTSTDGGTSWTAPQPDAQGSLTATAEGITLVRFRARDVAGNAGAWSAPASARVDTTAPALPTVTGSSSWSKASSVNAAIASTGDTLGAAASSGVSYYLARTSMNGGATFGASKQTSGTLAVTAEGVSDISAAACDAAGNCSAYSQVSAAARVSIDRTPPTVPVVTGGDGAATCTSYVASQVFTASATDALSGINFYQSAGTNGTKSTGVQNGNPRTISSTSITGRIQLQFVAIDRAGNVGGWSSLNDAGGIRCIGP